MATADNSPSIPDFNAPFLASLVVCGVLSIFFLLYFNRLFAWGISSAIRAYTWHQYRVHIDISALQISLLGGRIFFTGLRYHGNNETILIQNGYITWSYWLRRVREVDLCANDGSDKSAGPDSGNSRRTLPCRINVVLVGLEWFVYNRSAAYDAILAGMTKDIAPGNPPIQAPFPKEEGASTLRSRQPRRHRRTESNTDDVEKGEDDSSETEKPGQNGAAAHPGQGFESSRSEAPDEATEAEPLTHGNMPLMLQLFPIHMECEKAALVMGNENTKAVLIVKTTSLDGEIGASATHTPDPYRQLFQLNFTHPVVEMRENMEYKEDQADKAARERRVAQDAPPIQKRSFFHRQRKRILGQLRDLVPYWRSSVESFSTDSRKGLGTAGSQIPGSSYWQGLSRYLDDESDDQRARWAAVEYAAVPTIIDSPRAALTIFWDVPGKVRHRQLSRKEKPGQYWDNINGDEPPAWSINLSIGGGSINYGPWADRLRAELQRVFFPSLCKDAVPHEPLPEGADRLPTQFKLYVELEDEATIRIPTREDSKNWRWKGKEPGPKHTGAKDRRKARSRYKKSDATQGPAHQRPYGWLDMKVAPNTTVSYSMDMTASAAGFSNRLNIDLPRSEISSSVNHELLWRCGPQQISCDLSTPLKWNGLRQWHFNVSTEKLDLYLLRDHVFLLIDLVDDWASGPPAEYLVFTPFKYFLDLQLRNVRLFLNVNDANIINNPTDMDDNAYIIIESPLLQSTTCISMDKYRPSKNSIPFDIRAETGSLRLHLPPWNTQACFLPSKDIGHLENLLIQGEYHYNATTSPANTDTLILNISGQSPVAQLHGFTIRYFLKLKDNYFGEDVHFRTLEEYQETLRLKQSNPGTQASDKAPHKKSNDLDVMLSIRADDPKVTLPANLYSGYRHTQIDTAALSIDLRFTNYYMDLDVFLAPLNLSQGSPEDEVGTPTSATSSTQLFIDGLRVYGHRVFGLPPTEPTYLCNWDFAVGAITGECTPEFITTLMGAGQSFGFTFDDEENALVSFSSVVLYDITFLRLHVQSLSIWLHVEEAAFMLSTGMLDVNYNDWARSHYSRRANIRIPDVEISCVNSESAAKHHSKLHRPVETDALIQTSIHLAIISRKFDFSNERQLQQELVRSEDQRTHRTEFLLLPNLLDAFEPERTDPPAQSVPPVPFPISAKDIETDGESISSSATTSRRSKALRNKASFLSFASSSSSSVLRPQSSRRSSTKARPGGLLQPFTPADRQLGSSTYPPTHQRDKSTSTIGRHSAFYSAVGDTTDRRDVFHNTVAFSSQYFAPYFPLETVKADPRDAVAISFEKDSEAGREEEESPHFDLEDIDPDILSQNCAYSSTLLELPVGITAFFNSRALRYVSTLMSVLQPRDPEDVLDTLQLDTMKEVFGMQKQQKIKGHINDLCIRIPGANLRFINSSGLDSSDLEQEEQDKYDFTLTKLALASRSEASWTDAFRPESRKSKSSFHLRLHSLELSASERFAELDNPQAALLARVEHVMVSMGSRDLTYFDADIGSIYGSTSSEKIEYLASLIERTTAVADELGNLFAETARREKCMIQHLVHRLITEGQGIPDPSFLIRPSAVLRSAPQHIRTYDSWKLIMRLRQTWSVMHADQKTPLRLDCLGAHHVLPADVRRQAIESFERWRSWDLEDLSENVLLNRIFGKPENAGQPVAPDGPLLGVARIRKFQLVLDPGPKQNEIGFVDLTARLEMKNTDTDPDTNEPTSTAATSVVLNLHCADAAISLNWELCELAGDILRLYNKAQARPKPISKQSEEPPKRDIAEKPQRRARMVHCVLALDKGSVVVETVNIHASSLSEDLNASLLIRTDAQDILDTNFIVGCDTLTTRLRSNYQPLAKVLLRKPSIFLAHETQAGSTTDSHTVKATASSQDMSLIVRQDPISLSEVLDQLVKDEFAQLYKLKSSIPSSPAPASQPTTKIADRLSAFRVNVAMFMDGYTISVPLLRSLTYTVSGTVARVAMAADLGKEVIVDFDIKENAHEMQINVNTVPRRISLLQIPPTNGRVTNHISPGENSLSVFASLELVQLDASAVYSLLSALNRPEVSNAINDLQHQVKVIQEHAKEIFGEDDALHAKPISDSPEKPPAILAYAIHMTFAGLEVFGNTHLKSKGDPIAHISFSLDSVHLEMANRVDSHGPILAYPEVHANLRQVAFDIHKGRPDGFTSCGNLSFGALITASSITDEDGEEKRSINLNSDGFEVNLSPDTISTVVDALGYMGDKIRDIDTSQELEFMRKLRQSKPRIAINDKEQEEESDIIDSFFSSITYTLEIRDIQVCWLVAGPQGATTFGKDDLVLSFERIEFGTRTRNSARLTIENLQLQMVSPHQDRRLRSPNSALLPEVVFNVAYVSTAKARRLAFQAVGKSLDLRLTSGFIVPAAHIKDSISLSVENVQKAAQHWNPVLGSSPTKAQPQSPPSSAEPRPTILGSKRLESLLVDADFAGAVVYLSGKAVSDGAWAKERASGRYGQFVQEETSSTTSLKSPGLAWKIEYRDDGREDPSLFAEVKIDASSNILYPSVVPLIMDITNSVKEVVSKNGDENDPPNLRPETSTKSRSEEENILTADPSVVLGRLKLNLGLRICKQEFALSCQPIARVAASASFEDVYFTANTVRSAEQGNFFAISGAFTKLQATVQHVYSRESTGSFEVDSIVLSLMNSKHVSGTSGVSAILNVTPMKIAVNAKQLQDFLLFREIWVPKEYSQTPSAPAARLVTETSQGHLVQRYQQVAATAAFPWTATISISALEIMVDLGQALGKSVFAIEEFWVSSKKTSDWEQNLCLGFKRIGVDSTGRISGFVTMQDFKLRTSIRWPEREAALNETPVIQASIGFSQLRVKVAFDYQAFLVADITSMEFLMYNVRRSRDGSGDRLVAIFDGGAVQVFGVTSSAAQAVALYQAFQRLHQERRANYETSLREIEKRMKRKSVSPAVAEQKLSPSSAPKENPLAKSPISLDTDVVVTLKALNLGVFPSTFSDNQVFKMEALNAQARFAASIENQRIHSILGLTLGQLRIGLAAVRHPSAPKAVSELSVEDVVLSATGSRGGTILKVPQVEAIMQTWQTPDAKQIDYIFKSAFEGKVEVGWNYSRVSYIRGMWANHTKMLATTWGREIPSVTSIRVTGVPEAPAEGGAGAGKEGGGDNATAEGKSGGEPAQAQKITAEVNVPQSKYEYRALEPPVIETPQLRDMGEATPPLEWIGLHRDRLPNLTHQIVIVSLLELAGEVEDAYSRILGSS